MTDYEQWINGMVSTIGPPADYCVYSLQCGPPADDAHILFDEFPRWFGPAAAADLRYYVGYTSNIYKRIEQHFEGDGAGFTRAFPPVDILQLEWFDKRRNAEAFEEKLAEGIRLEHMARIFDSFGDDDVENVNAYVYQH